QQMDLREKILFQTEEMFMRYGIKSVTMDDISRELGISKKTLYQFVDNKADLIQQIFHEHTKREIEAMTAIKAESKNALEEMLSMARYVSQMIRKTGPKVIFDLKKYYRPTYELMESFHQQTVYRIIRENLEQGIREKIYRKEIDVDIISKLYVVSTFQIVDDGIFPMKDYNRETLYWELIKYHINGIASAKGLELLQKYSGERRRQK
ncbi:MAG: TetR/AcrR family transcriptional regulator, partial [Bacteroidota bacterium]